MTNVFRRAFTAIAAIACLASLSATASADTLADVQQRSELKVLVTNNIPYSYKEPGSDKWIGYNIDLINRLGEIMKWKITLIESDWATLIPNLQARKADLIIAPMTLTTARGAVLNLTSATVYSGNDVIVRADDKRFNSYADLNKPDVTFAAFPNAQETLIRSFFPDAQIKIITSDNANAPRMEVLVGRSDASTTDHLNALNFIKANPGARVLSDQPFSASGLHWGTRPDDIFFARFLNTFLEDMGNLGVIQSFGEKWNVQTHR
jgi:ABC-type amino acid transport substrate-binding protein